MATFADDLAGGSSPKAAILLIVGEPFTDDNKQSILEEIVKGFKCWDSAATGVDINDELAQIANRADLGEEGPDGERIIRHRSDNAAIEMLMNPQSQTVKDSLKAILTQLSPAKMVLYAGYAFQGIAAWVVQDELFSFSTFNQVFKDPNVENALKQMEGGASLTLHTTAPDDWASALKGSDVDRLVKVAVNPKPHLDHVHGVVQFTAYVGNLCRPLALGSLLQPSDYVGSISFTRPVLYIFPGQHGDSALFAMKGFNLLVDGGYSRRSCFWDFVRHLDGIDALLMTHLGPDNLFGIKALLERKAEDQIHPNIDYMYMNAGKVNGAKALEAGGLVMNLATEGSRLQELSQKLGHNPHPLTRSLSGNLEPINLFHKVGKGSLDMYVLNPVGDAKEMKDFLSQWDKHASSFSQVNGVPVPNCTSICALLVVRPASPTENVTRILFPGTAPQHKLLEGLERVKHLEFLKHPTFCTHDMHKPKKPAAASAGAKTGSSTRKPPVAASSKTSNAKSESSLAAPRARAEPPKRLETTKSSASRVSAAAPSAAGRAGKVQKETNNKRASSAKDKEKVKMDEKEKEDKSKSSGSSSPSKASVKTASPTKTPSTPAKSPAKTPSSPTKTPAAKSPSKEPAAAPVPVEPIQPPVSAEQTPSPMTPEANNHVDLLAADVKAPAPPANVDMMGGDSQPMGAPEAAFPPMAGDSPQAPLETAGFGTCVDSAPPPASLSAQQQQLQELGVYDDEGVDDSYDDREYDAGFGVQPQSLPEPTAVVETPSSADPDLIHDALSQQSDMVRSQIFDQEIEPDYSAELKDTSPPEPQTEQMEQQHYSDKEQSPAFEKEISPAFEKEVSPSFEKEVSPGFGEKEQSPAFGQKEESPGFEKEVSPGFEKEVSPGFGEKEQSPAFEKEVSPAFGQKEESPAYEKEESPAYEKEESPAYEKEESPAYEKEESPAFEREESPVYEEKEASPALEEPHFSDDPVESDAGNNSIAQNIQYGMPHDNGFQMGGIREEEEEEVAAERDTFGGEAAQGQPEQQASDLNKQSMEELGIYDDDEGQEEEEEPEGHYGKDAFAYDNDRNLEDEEIRMAQHQQDQQGSHLPEAFERDESPTPMEKPVAGQEKGEECDSGQEEEEDTDSIDGGTPDHDKDIDEALAMQHKQDSLASGEAEGQNFNPFIGLGAQNPMAGGGGAADLLGDDPPANAFAQGEADEFQQRGGPMEFDPLAQWGPPTGLPAPSPLQEECGLEEQQQQQEALAPQEASPDMEANGSEHMSPGQDFPTPHGMGQDFPAHGFGMGQADWDKKPVHGFEMGFGESVGKAGSDKGSEADPSEFDPLAEWGQPMGLPAPPPTEPSKPTAAKAGSGDSKKPEAKKPGSSPMKAKPGADKRPASAPAKSPAKATNGTAEPPKSARPKPEPRKANLDSSRTARPASSQSLNSSRTESSKSRPATAPTARKPAGNSAAANKARSSPDVIKMPPLPPMTPFYMDLTYIPNHGDTSYVDGEFFKRVRARYYVLSARSPNPKVLEMLMDAKATWDKANEYEVTVIPTYETPILQHWLMVHKEKLAESKITISPAASRCTVRLQDHEDSCYTYRLDF